MSAGKNAGKFCPVPVPVEGVHVEGKKILYLVNGSEKQILTSSSNSNSSSSSITATATATTTSALASASASQSPRPFFGAGRFGPVNLGAAVGSNLTNRSFQNLPPSQFFGVIDDDDEEEDSKHPNPNSKQNGPSSFLGGNSDWKFNGEMCFNVESTSLFHLTIALTSGRSPDHVKMVMSISKCPDSKSFWSFVNVPTQLKLHFLDEHNKILQSNYIHIPTESVGGKKRETPICHEVENQVLMSTETLLKLCQFKRKGNPLLIKRVNNSETDGVGTPIDSEFEFVKVVVEVDAKLRTSSGNDFLKSSACNIDFSKYLPSTSLSINLTASKTRGDFVYYLGSVSASGSNSGAGSNEGQPFKFTIPALFPTDKKVGASGFNFIPPDAPTPFALGPSLAQNSNQNQNPDQDQSEAEQTQNIKIKSQYSEMIKLEVGPNSEEFYVHREIFMKKSPAFELMLTVDMKEKKDGTILLKEEDPETVQKFIKYLYTQKLDQIANDSESENADGQTKTGTDDDLKCLDVVELLDLLKFAHMYEIADLLSDVTGLIVASQNESLVLEVALAIFWAGCQFEIPDLKFRALQWIKANKSNVLSSEGQKVFKLFMQGKDEVVSDLLFHIL